LHVVYKHPSEVAEAVLMDQKFDAHGLASEGCHIHRLIGPALRIQTLMEDRLQDVAIVIGDVSILPVEIDGIGCTIPVPETQGSSGRRHRELLVKGAISQRFVIRIEAAEAIRCVTNKS
jgi:hypothetical protein